MYVCKVAVAISNLSVAVDGSGDTERALSLIQSSVSMAEDLMQGNTESVAKDELKSNLAVFYINLAKTLSNKGEC